MIKGGPANAKYPGDSVLHCAKLLTLGGDTCVRDYRADRGQFTAERGLHFIEGDLDSLCVQRGEPTLDRCSPRRRVFVVPTLQVSNTRTLGS